MYLNLNTEWNFAVAWFLLQWKVWINGLPPISWLPIVLTFRMPVTEFDTDFCTLAALAEK